MQRCLLFLSLLISPIVLAIPQFGSERQSRTRIELAGKWLKERVKLSHSLSVSERTRKAILKLEKEAHGRYLADYNDYNWHECYIPNPENIPPDRYQGGVWYRRRFLMPPAVKDKFIRLQFEGVNYVADVWINGKWAGSHEGGYTPFNFDITQYINFGIENTIAIRVDNIPWDSRQDIVPYKRCDWWNYGGILRDVYIEICERINIANAYVKKGEVKIILLNSLGVETKANLDIKIWETRITGENIIDPRPEAIIDSSKLISSQTSELLFSDGESIKEINLKLPIKNPKSWSPQDPHLYVLEASLSNGDTFYTQFGIRDIRVKAGRLFLNNKIIYLNGTARHEVFGATDLYNDLKAMKEMNVNFLRTGHYPNGPELYVLTDRMGILVWEEIPVYWFDTEGFNNQLWRRIADGMWLEMIKRDFNRPSVILWGTCNECATQGERREFIKRLYDQADSIDGTRLIGQSASGSDPLDKTHDLCDVIGITMYYGIFYGKDPYSDTLKALEIMHAVFPDKPIIVTEFGTWSGLDLSLADKQVEIAQQNLKAFFEKPYCVGWAWWCMFDWYSMITTFQTMGTITLNREYIKPIYYYLQKTYGNKLSPLEVEITEPYHYATVRGIVKIKTIIKSPFKIEEANLTIGNEEVDPFMHEWDTRKIPDGEYLLRLRVRDSSGVTQTSMKKVFVDNIDDGPRIAINLDDGDWLMHNKRLEIQLSDDRSPPMDLAASLIIDSEEKELSSKLTFDWGLDSYPDKSIHTLVIKAEDGNKNITEKVFNVTIDNTPGTYVKLPYNHDWVSWNENMSDGTGWDFPAEELPDSNLDFICNKVKFLFGDKKDGMMNNIECQGQIIEIPAGIYKNIYILASSHEGSGSDDLIFVYEDGSRESQVITISDWWGAMPMFEEQLAIRCTHHHERNEKENPPGVGIYLRIISINPEKKLKSIILPNEPRIHIFCMTLE